MGLAAATLGQRITAGLNTFVPVLLYVLVPGFVIARMDLERGLTLALMYGLPIALVTLDGAGSHATYGMRVVSLCFRSSNAERIGYWWCVARILLGIVLLPLLPVSAIVAVFNERRRTLADLICGTVVWHDPKQPEEEQRRGFEVMPLEQREHL